MDGREPLTEGGLSVESALSFPGPWRRLAPPDAARLTEELREELAAGHVLFDRKFRVLAKCEGCDHTLVRVGDEWAMVHLSWARPDRPPWPNTEVAASLAEIIEEFSDHH